MRARAALQVSPTLACGACCPPRPCVPKNGVVRTAAGQILRARIYYINVTFHLRAATRHPHSYAEEFTMTAWHRWHILAATSTKVGSVLITSISTHVHAADTG